MPRAKDGRKPVGTAPCSQCETEAAFYQVKTGKRKGYLYRRCGCGCDQKTGEAVQREWLAVMVPTGEPMIEHPLNLDEPEPVPSTEPQETPNDESPEPQTPRKVSGVFGVLAVVATVAAAVIMA